MSEAYSNALILARAGLPVFASSRIFGPGTEEIATTDAGLLASMNHVDPKAVWMVKAGAELGLLALDTPRARDMEHLISDFGPLPRTLIVTRPSGGTVRWFACDANADVKLGEFIRATKARFRRFAVIPGSVHRETGEEYEIVNGGPLDLGRMARLPDAWIQAVPRNAEGITANVTKRHEFVPRVSEW
jgi:hypothetical protein